MAGENIQFEEVKIKLCTKFFKNREYNAKIFCFFFKKKNYFSILLTFGFWGGSMAGETFSLRKVKISLCKKFKKRE